MATDGETSPEDEMLPDEAAVITERGSHREELDDDEYLTTEEVAESLDINLE